MNRPFNIAQSEYIEQHFEEEAEIKVILTKQKQDDIYDGGLRRSGQQLHTEEDQHHGVHIEHDGDEEIITCKFIS